MGCDHESVRVGRMSARRSRSLVKLTLGELSCRDCGAELELVSVLRDDGDVVLALRAVGYDASDLRCGSCGRRLFGSPEEVEGPPWDDSLDRGAIVDVRCGPCHQVVYADGAVLEVADGRVRRVL